MVTLLTFLVKNGKMKLSGLNILENTRQKPLVKSRTRSRPKRDLTIRQRRRPLKGR